ncbi:MAG TPA: DUF368 domain-containing protein [Acidimicrobiaceae bacterium]|nr:DUF368 domain-containing protein [Acidimicrobiaceae bacterium]
MPRRPAVAAGLANLARGFAMGAADVVPGVSGGTVALLLGVYERLVGQIRAVAAVAGRLLTGRLRAGRLRAGAARAGTARAGTAYAGTVRIEPAFLAALLAGIALAVLLLADRLGRLLDDYPVEVSAAFLGLVAASVVVVRRRVGRWTAGRVVVAVVAAAGAFAALGLRSGGVDNPSAAVLFGAGAVAVCAMILPGVSGAFVLLLLGLYDYVLDALGDRDVADVAVFAAGAVVGLALFSNLLGRLLARRHDTTLAVLVGLTAGSLRVLWPWPAAGGVENAALGAPDTDRLAVSAALALAAFAVVVLLARLTGNHRAVPHPTGMVPPAPTA